MNHALDINTILHTKDGRKIGNAIIVTVSMISERGSSPSPSTVLTLSIWCVVALN